MNTIRVIKSLLRIEQRHMLSSRGWRWPYLMEDIYLYTLFLIPSKYLPELQRRVSETSLCQKTETPIFRQLSSIFGKGRVPEQPELLAKNSNNADL